MMGKSAPWEKIPAIKDLIEKYEGKEIYMCDSMGGKRLNFDLGYIGICHEGFPNKPLEISSFGRYEEFSLQSFYQQLSQIMEKMQEDDFLCRNCSLCHKEIFHFRPLSFVVVTPGAYCNSSCIYCSCSGLSKDGPDMIPILTELVEAGLVDKNTFFDYGGGEPTQANRFEEVVGYLAEQGFRQRVNTNAIDFSPKTYEALKKGTAILRVSPDAGTREGFLKMKGHPEVNKVWGNIARYAQASSEVYVKCNVCNYNCSRDELDAFLQRCREAKVKHVYVDAEMRSYQAEKNAGPFYYTREVFDGFHYLYDQAKVQGFQVEVSTYAFAAHPFYDEQHRVTLPPQYVDNTDYEAICNGIYVEVFSTFEELWEIVDAEPDRDLIIFGYGRNGRIAAKALEQVGKSFTAIDNNWQRFAPEDNVKSAVEYFTDKTHISLIIVTPNNVGEMVRQINESGQKARILWCSGSCYRGYAQNVGIA